MNITIDNTTKSGWLKLSLNGYYNGTDGDSEHWTPLDHVTGICVGKISGCDYVELHIEHEDNSFLLTWNTPTSHYVRQVDEINGVAPTSITDLRDKLLSLL